MMKIMRLRWRFVIMIFIFPVAAALGGEIEQGTIAIGASSNALFYFSDYSSDDYGNSSRGLSVSMEAGYFFLKNLEIGTAISLSLSDATDYSGQSYFLKPYIGYHWTLTEKSNFYVQVGGGYGCGSTDNDSGIDSNTEATIIFAELGYEYFLNKNVSLGLGLTGEQTRRTLKYSDMEDITATSNDLSTQLKLKFYF